LKKDVGELMNGMESEIIERLPESYGERFLGKGHFVYKFSATECRKQGRVQCRNKMCAAVNIALERL
jgi:RNase P/RNase MRP subunit POP5